MLALQKTIEIDPSRRLLRLDEPLPETIPCGTAQVVLQFVLPTEHEDRTLEAGIDARKIKYQAARRKLRDICRDSSLSVERFLAMKQAGRALETAQDERLFAETETR